MYFVWNGLNSYLLNYYDIETTSCFILFLHAIIISFLNIINIYFYNLTRSTLLLSLSFYLFKKELKHISIISFLIYIDEYYYHINLLLICIFLVEIFQSKIQIYKNLYLVSRLILIPFIFLDFVIMITNLYLKLFTTLLFLVFTKYNIIKISEQNNMYNKLLKQ